VGLLNVAMPATAATVLVWLGLALAVPLAPVMATFTLPVKPVTLLPPASRALTTPPKLAPAVVLAAGWVVKASWVAVPIATLNVALVAALGPVAVAASV